MNTFIHRKQEGVTGEAVLDLFKDELTKKEEQYQSQTEIEKLVNTYAISPTDNFVVTDVEDLKTLVCQGDINLCSVNSNYYKEVKGSIDILRDAKDMNLQEGVSVTGDHRIVALENSEMSIRDARFQPKDNILKRRPYECKIVKSNKPFLITHREHGNIAMPAGEYLVFSSLNAETLQRVWD